MVHPNPALTWPKQPPRRVAAPQRDFVHHFFFLVKNHQAPSQLRVKRAVLQVTQLGKERLNNLSQAKQQVTFGSEN